MTRVVRVPAVAGSLVTFFSLTLSGVCFFCAGSSAPSSMARFEPVSSAGGEASSLAGSSLAGSSLVGSSLASSSLADPRTSYVLPPPNLG